MTTPAYSVSPVYPSWWGDATTVEVVTVTNGSVTLDPADVELFPWGVSAATSGEWDAAILPWSQIVNVHQAS
jgi:hypothetical protein